MIRLAFIITGLSTGGAEMMLLKLLQNIDRERFFPVVISLTDKGSIGGKIQELGISVHALEMSRSAPNPFIIIELSKLLKSYSPDIVHTWMYHADLIGGLSARLAGFKNVIWCIRHSNLSKEENKFTTRLVAKTCAKLSSFIPARIVSCSHKAVDVHSRLGYRSSIMTVIPNGFELERFNASKVCRERVRSQLNIASFSQVVGFVARFDPQKNHFGFIECAAKVIAELPNVVFVLVGMGVDHENGLLVSKLKEHGLCESFRLLGHQDDIPSLMTAFDVLASPSNGEGFPNVLGEAMASQVPCVVTDVGDSSEIVGRTGKVVAVGDMEALSRGVISILSMPLEGRTTLAIQARQRVSENYEIKHVTSLYESCYRDVLAH